MVTKTIIFRNFHTVPRTVLKHDHELRKNKFFTKTKVS